MRKEAYLVRECVEYLKKATDAACIRFTSACLPRRWIKRLSKNTITTTGGAARA